MKALIFEFELIVNYLAQVHTSSPILQRDKDEKYNKSGLKRSVINMSSGKYQGDLIASKEYVQNSSKILASKQQISSNASQVVL